MTEALRFSLETAPGFSCKGRLQRLPPCAEGKGGTPRGLCQLQPVVRRPTGLGLPFLVGARDATPVG